MQECVTNCHSNGSNIESTNRLKERKHYLELRIRRNGQDRFPVYQILFLILRPVRDFYFIYICDVHGNVRCACNHTMRMNELVRSSASEVE